MILLLMFFKYLAWLSPALSQHRLHAALRLYQFLGPNGDPCSILVGFAVTDHSNAQNHGFEAPDTCIRQNLSSMLVLRHFG